MVLNCTGHMQRLSSAFLLYEWLASHKQWRSTFFSFSLFFFFAFSFLPFCLLICQTICSIKSIQTRCTRILNSDWLYILHTETFKAVKLKFHLCTNKFFSTASTFSSDKQPRFPDYIAQIPPHLSPLTQSRATPHPHPLWRTVDVYPVCSTSSHKFCPLTAPWLSFSKIWASHGVSEEMLQVRSVDWWSNTSRELISFFILG